MPPEPAAGPARRWIVRVLPSERGDWRPWAAVAVAWTGYGLARALLWWLLAELPPRALYRKSVVEVSTAWLWLAMTPAVLALARRLPWRRGGRARLAAAHLATALGAAAAEAWWTRVVVPREPGPFALTYLLHLDMNLFVYAVVAGAAYAARYWRAEQTRGVDAALVETHLTRARLHALLAQLHPHFLFNTLNSIAELVHCDARAARRTLGHLRAMLRMSLGRAAGAEVTLRDELRVLHPFLEIQRLRFGDRLSVETAVPAELLDARVPYLVLQPLVENAIRHGTAPLDAPGLVSISARRRGGRLVLEVRDNGAGVAPPDDGGRAREGLGLSNTRVRLRHLYGDAQSLTLRGADGGGTVATLDVPFRWGGDGGGAAEAPAKPASEPDPELEAGPAPRRGRRRMLRTAGAIVGAWVLLGVIWAGELVAIDWVARRSGVVVGPPVTWPGALAFNVRTAAEWVLLTPAIVWLALRWPLGRRRWPTLVPLHAALAAAVALGHMALRRAADPTRANEPLLGVPSFGVFLWESCTYLVIVGVASAVQARSRYDERGLQVARLQRELARAEADAMRWQLRPRLLLDTLGEIGALAGHDPARADEMTTRLGDLLRLTLEGGGAPQSTLRREAELAESYLGLESIRRDASDSLVVRVGADPALLDAPLPTMTLQPLAEQLLARARGRATCVAIDARRNGRALSVTLRAYVEPAPDGAPPPAADDGLSALRERLALRFEADEVRIAAHASARSPAIVLELPLGGSAP
ncbi:MAG TPA: histidine kinase [Gemmatimonadaceae bacterium]|nr:histidine kinase [Gemmatimonadaceae bacterium]